MKIEINRLVIEFAHMFLNRMEVLIHLFKNLIVTAGSRMLKGIKHWKWLLITFFIIIVVPLVLRHIIWQVIGVHNFKAIQDQRVIEHKKEKLLIEIKGLNHKLQLKTPRGYYLVINSSSNHFSLYKGEQLIKRDKCSTGSYVLLKNGEHQQWMFKTPKGEFRIRNKRTSPVWKKPDWAFIEDGLPVPSANHYSRFERGVLGDYALDLGDGYMIHGTLYQRFLGLPVTHGCIRLNDENLELVYKSLGIGSRVYIY